MSVDVENYVGGVPVVVLGTDGTKLYGLLCDTGGRLQIVAGPAGVPADAATETTLDAIRTAAEIIDGFAHQSNVLFGYNDRYFAVGNDNDAAAGDLTKDFEDVDAGEVWVIQNVMGQNVTRAARISLQFYDGSDWTKIREYTSAGAGQPVTANGEWVLKEGDLIRVVFYGTVLHDVLRWRAWGYKMKV